MGLDHVIYIPGVMIVGLVVGYFLGQRAVMARIAAQKQRQKD